MEPDRAVEFIQGHQGRGVCDTQSVETKCVSERCFEKGGPLDPSAQHALLPYGSQALKSLSQYLWNVVLL